MDKIADQVERSRKQRKSFIILVVSAFAATATVALVAIGISLYLLKQNAQFSEAVRCQGRITTYAADVRDDMEITGWDALVTRSVDGGANQDVRAIALQMRQQIDELKGHARDMRVHAGEICSKNPDFDPRRQ